MATAPREVRRRRVAVALSALAVLVAAGAVAGVAASGRSADRAGDSDSESVSDAARGPARAPTALVPSSASAAPVGTASAASVGTPAGTSPAPTVEPTSGPLPVTLSQPVAVADSDGLALLAGDTRTELADTAGAEVPGLSHDGRYLSWLVPAASGVTLHIADRTTGRRRAVDDVTAYAWSPTSDQILMCGSTQLRVQTLPSLRMVSRAEGCYSPTWSPDGSRLAVIPGNATLVLTTTLTPVITLPSTAAIARFVGDGLLAWPDPGGAESLDGRVLTDYNLSNGRAFPLTTTLPYPDWVQPAGAGRYVVVAGASRFATNKHLVSYDVPSYPTASDPPHLDTPGITPVEPRTDVTSLAAGPDSYFVVRPADGQVSYGVDGSLAVDKGGDSALVPDGVRLAAVTRGPDGSALLVTGDSLLLRDSSGEHDLGPVGPLLVDDVNALDRHYYNHVDPGVIIGQPAGTTP